MSANAALERHRGDKPAGPFMEIIEQSLSKTYIHMPFDPVIPCLGIYLWVITISRYNYHVR